MDELYRGYCGLYVEQKEVVKERLIAAVVDSLDSLSDVVCDQLLSIAESYRHLNALTATQANQELVHAQNIVQEAGRVYGQQLASTLTLGLDSLNILPTVATGSVAFNQPTADISISDTQAQFNTSTNQSNDTNEDIDDDTLSVKSEINSEDECNSDSDSQPDVDIKEEPEETQTETEINQTGDTATVKEEMVSSSECESDSDSDDYESDTMQVKEEEQEDDEIRFVQNSNNPDFIPDGASIEESENIAQSNGNVETVNSNENNNEHQSDEMMMDDEENVDEDEPNITVVNYEEFEEQFIDQNSLLDGSFNGELENVSQQEGNGNTVDSHMIDSNEINNEHSSGHEVLDNEENITEAISEQTHAGPSVVSNTASTLTRPSTRVSAAKVNYSETMENSVTEQKDTLHTGSRKDKRKTGPSGKSNAPKRSRVVPAPTVSAVEEYQHQVNGDSGEEEGDPESEDISLSIIVRRLNCRVPGCKKVFPSKVQLDDHLLVKHGIEKYACKVKDCIESYATRTELTTHRDTTHYNLDNNWPCGQCEMNCTSYQLLNKHVYQYHEYGLFACSADKCDFTEKIRAKVQDHQLKHRPAKYRCTYAGCSSSFNKKSNLTAHLRVHSKAKPFLCSQCPKAFAQKIALTVHERMHSGLKPFSCTWPHCDFSASQQSTVIGHIRGVHFGLPQSKKKQREKGIIDNRDARLFLKKGITTGN